MSRLFKYLVLPKEISAFEANYLRRMNRIGLVFFALHIPVMSIVAWANGTRPLLAAALSAAVLAGPALAYATLANPRTISIVYGMAAMFMGGLLVHFGQGPMQIEMHFYFFALIAMLAVFGNPLVIVAAAVTVALHHLIVWMVLPRSVFNYGVGLGRSGARGVRGARIDRSVLYREKLLRQRDRPRENRAGADSRAR
jgi:hypothetical protein